MDALARPEIKRFELKRLIFWDFPRASWRYDVVVGLILLFIFATPRAWFHDQPRAAGVVLIAADTEQSRFFISGDLLAGLDDNARWKRAESLINERTGKRWHLSRLEPIQDAEERDTRGFLAYTQR